jgi:long-chain acyl-CoA synthetase
LPQLLRDNAREMGRATAIRSKRAGIWRATSWDELYARVLRTAAALEALGLAPGEAICLISENREEAWITQMSAIALGAVAVSVYPDASAEELDHVLGHSGAAFLLAKDQEQVDKALSRDGAEHVRRILYIDPNGLWDYADPRLVRLDDAVAEAPPAEAAERRIAEATQGDIAVYCYTSGTTGKPKAAMLDHAFILDNAYRLMGALGIRPGGNYLSYISPAWAAEQFFGVGLPLLAPLVLHFAEKPETVQADLREIGPDFLMFTPRQWEMQASAVEARMMDAGPWRQRLFRWGLARGHLAAGGPARAQGGARSARAHAGEGGAVGGIGPVARAFRALPRLRRAAGQSLRQLRAGPRGDPSAGRQEPRNPGPPDALGPDDRRAAGGLARRRRAVPEGPGLRGLSGRCRRGCGAG